MKKKIKIISIILVVIVVFIFIRNCGAIFKWVSQLGDEIDVNIYELSPEICKWALGVTPQEFCESNGKGSTIGNSYYKASINDKGNLVLKLTSKQEEDWKTNYVYMQILQQVVGDKKQLVTEKIRPNGPILDIMFDSASQSGVTVSNDYTKIISKEGNDLLCHSLPWPCIILQVLDGKPSEDIIVEYILIDESGKEIERTVFPN